VDRRALLRTAAHLPLALLASRALGAGVTAGAGAPLRAKRLGPGSTVMLVAPASNVEEDVAIEASAELLESLGFRVKLGPNLFRRNQYLAGTDAERAADLNGAFRDPEVEGIVCLRGGYGSARILPLLDYDALRRHPKVILGYSDITAILNAVYAKTGLITFHGPIAATNLTPYALAAFDAVLTKPEAPVALAAPPAFEAVRGQVRREDRLQTFQPGVAEGVLVGGNLSLVASLLGSPYLPDFQGKILFLEDVYEAPYSIDRMLTQLWLGGVLEQVAGLVFGKFTDAEDSNNTFSVETVLRERCPPGKPCLRGVMIGHIDDQAVVPVGARVRLDADAQRLTLLETAVR
jgi:muramoyltetrapeptide carboxypeptidase